MDSVSCKQSLSVPPVEINDVREPGAYISSEFGFLLRMPAEALTGTPRMTITWRRSLSLMRISDDPWLRVSEARRRASDLNLLVDF
jgi:hypothetical protein